jgi:hypothetical protein
LPAKLVDGIKAVKNVERPKGLLLSGEGLDFFGQVRTYLVEWLRVLPRIEAAVRVASAESIRLCRGGWTLRV